MWSWELSIGTAHHDLRFFKFDSGNSAENHQQPNYYGIPRTLGTAELRKRPLLVEHEETHQFVQAITLTHLTYTWSLSEIGHYYSL